MGNRVSYARYTHVVIAFGLMTWASGATAAGEDWSGWRGQAAQGVSTTPGPVEWSPESNVVWKTEIRGQGHSSPVTSEGKVFVTTAYPTKLGPELRPLFIRITNIIGLIVGIVAAAHVVSLVRANQVHLAMSLCLLGGLFAKEVVSAVRYAFGTHREAIYLSWLDSHLVIGLACLLAMTVATRSVRLVLGAGLIVIGMSLAGLRPDPEYYGFLSGAHHLRGTSSAILGVLLGTGLIALCVGISRVNRVDAGRSIGTSGLMWGLIAFVIGISSLGVPVILSTIHAWRPDIGLPWIMLSQLGMRTCGIVLAALLWCIVGLPYVPERSNLKIVGGVVAVAGLTFWTTNFLRSEDTHGRAIVCLDIQTGKPLWTCEGLYGPIPSTHLANSPASPTPLVEGGRVYAYFGTAGMMAANMDGDLLWTNSELPFEGIHGVAASPVAHEGVIFVTSGNSKDPYIAAIDGGTGARIWTAHMNGWDGLHGEHRTPLIVAEDSAPTIFNWSMKSACLTGYNLNDGCETQRYETDITNTGEAVASMVVDRDTLYLPSKSTIAAVKWPSDNNTPEFRWMADLRSKGPNTASPVLNDDLLYFVSDHGIGTCLDAKTGEVCWQKRLARGSYYSSPVVMGDHVYFSNNRGVTTVVACGSKFEKVAENSLPDGIYASSAPWNRHLLIRTESAVWCVGAATEESSATPATGRLSQR